MCILHMDDSAALSQVQSKKGSLPKRRRCGRFCFLTVYGPGGNADLATVYRYRHYTGQITYNKGTSQELDINFLILQDGRELRGMLQNAGTAVQCDLIRMGASDDHAHE
jgi:hypothetical protein